jgi:putative transposase
MCVVIEDLNVCGMSKNRPIAGAGVACGCHEFRRQLRYKAAMGGGHIVVADRFFPSSEDMLGVCGCVNPDGVLGLDVWTCIEWGVVHKRDPNGAINLESEARLRPNQPRPDMAPLPACLHMPARAADEPEP